MINHKFIGYHNQDQVVSTYGPDKDYAEAKCNELLLGYFHEITPGLTKMPLKYYNGVVAYIGQKVDHTNSDCVEYKYKKHDERIEKENKKEVK